MAAGAASRPMTSLPTNEEQRVHEIVSLPVPAITAVALLFGAVLTGFALAILRLCGSLMQRKGEAVPLPTFIGVVATAWALALGFTAADIWATNGTAERIASSERSSIGRLAGIARADSLDVPDLLRALRDYSAASTEHEWKASANSEPSLAVERALQAIRREIVRSALGGVPAPLVSKMVIDFDELQDARNDRLGIGSRSVSDLKWYLVAFLTFLSIATIAVAHGERPAAGRMAVMIFACTATVSIWILMLYANPYVGVERIKPEEVNGFPFEAIAAAPAGTG